MRFLMFNICVLACLGYLFTASPDQSFSSWLTGTSKTVVASVDQVMQDGKDNIDNGNLTETASDLMAEITADITAPSETDQLREDIKSLKAEVSSLNTLLEDMQIPAATMTTGEAETPPSDVEPVILVEQADPAVSDRDIANAFAELAEAEQENLVAPSLDPSFNTSQSIGQNSNLEAYMDSANTTDPMRYMTPAERQQDLGKLMLDMQVFYLEKSGI